jgi:hypothetical protein
MASALRQARRVQAREEAELRAHLPELPPWPDPDDEWRNPARYREMSAARRQAEQTYTRQQIESGELPDTAAIRYQAGMLTYEEYREQSEKERQERLEEMIRQYGPDGPGPDALLIERLYWDDIRELTPEEQEARDLEEALEDYHARKEYKRAKRAGRALLSFNTQVWASSRRSPWFDDDDG